MPSTDTAPVTVRRQRFHRLLCDKMQKAGWQTNYGPGVKLVKRTFVQTLYGVTSTVDLTEDQLACAEARLRVDIISKPPSAEYTPVTVQQTKKIVRLGKYVLGGYYGETWFWKKIRLWISELYQDVVHETGINLSRRRVSRISHLTEREASYIIQRLEQVEPSLTRAGKI
jgi:hypothetical protein